MWCLRLTKVIQSTVRIVKKYINEYIYQIITYIKIEYERVAIVIFANLQQEKHVLIMYVNVFVQQPKHAVP